VPGGHKYVRQWRRRIKPSQPKTETCRKSAI